MLELPKTQGIIKLPLTAVMEHQGKTAVWLLDQSSMTVSPQPIQVAGAEGNSVLVRRRLAPGQVVVTAGVHVLTAGQKVKLYAPDVAVRIDIDDRSLRADRAMSDQAAIAPSTSRAGRSSTPR